MKHFLSLRKFLLLKDPLYNYPRSIHRDYGFSETFVLLYDAAKKSWEKFGDNGPPVGSKVETLVSGHGGSSGLVRTFGGIYSSDPRFFFISRIENGEERISLVQKKFWWIDIKVLD